MAMRRAWTRFLFAFAFAFGVIAAPAGAAHPSSLNMSLEFSDPNTEAITSDIAFWGDTAFVGNYNGVRTYDISNPDDPQRLADFQCFGPQNDPSVWDTDGDGAADLLVQSIDRTLTGPQCGAEATEEHGDPTGWEGIRLFDISDPANPQFVKGIYLDCGSHTNTLYPDPARNRLVVLISSYPLREGPTCGPVTGPAAGRDPLHGVIQTVFIPLLGDAQSSAAAAVEGPELPINYPGDPDNQFLPSEHGLVGEDIVDGMRACHDIAVFVPLRIVAAACAEQSQLWRLDTGTGLPDTSNPFWVFDRRNIDFHHSATFSWDGRYTNIIDESFGTGCPTVTPGIGQTGRMFFLDTSTGKRLSSFMIRRGHEPETPDYCSAHLGNVVPATDRYLLVNAWYTGGVDVIDFSKPRRPKEIAYYDDNGDEWSAYWYEQTGTQTTGALDVFGTHGVEHIAHGEGLELEARGFESFLATVSATRVALDHLNPQVQEEVIPVKVDEKKAKAGKPTKVKFNPKAGKVKRKDTVRRLAP
jgi:hypothetical protein